MPCTQPFTIHATPNQSGVDPSPKKTFAPTESRRPATMKFRAFARSAHMPFTNRESPYSRPFSVRKMPRSAFEI